jgi:hypothetical protein
MWSFKQIKKIQSNINGQNHHRGDKKGRPKKGQKTHNSQDPKKKKENKKGEN